MITVRLMARGAQVVVRTPFPLTPALSPEERESVTACFGQWNVGSFEVAFGLQRRGAQECGNASGFGSTIDSPEGAERFSLSSGERAGVRGNRARLPLDSGKVDGLASSFELRLQVSSHFVAHFIECA